MPNSHNTSRVIQWATTWPGSGILWITGTVAAIVTATTIATNIWKNESDKLDTTDELDITQILPDLPIWSGSPVTPEKHAQIQAQMNEQTKSDVKAFLLDKLHESDGTFDEPASPCQLEARARWML